MTTTVPAKRKPTRQELLSYVPGAIPPKPPAVTVPDLNDWAAFVKSLNERPVAETSLPNKLPPFMLKALDPGSLDKFKTCAGAYEKAIEEMEAFSVLKIPEEVERQRAVFLADPAARELSRMEISEGWRKRRKAILQRFFEEHGAAYAATLKALLIAARDVLQRHIRTEAAAEDAKARSLERPLPSPTWHMRSLIKLEDRLAGQLAEIASFQDEIARVARGSFDPGNLNLPGNFFARLLQKAST